MNWLFFTSIHLLELVNAENGIFDENCKYSKSSKMLRISWPCCLLVWAVPLWFEFSAGFVLIVLCSVFVMFAYFVVFAGLKLAGFLV
jgi:hypothetical protein